MFGDLPGRFEPHILHLSFFISIFSMIRYFRSPIWAKSHIFLSTAAEIVQTFCIDFWAVLYNLSKFAPFFVLLQSLKLYTFFWSMATLVNCLSCVIDQEK